MLRRVLLAGVDVQLVASVHVVFPNGEIVELESELVVERSMPYVKFDQRAALDMIHRSGDGSRRVGGVSVHDDPGTAWKGEVRL